jgi:hypothetical protein
VLKYRIALIDGICLFSMSVIAADYSCYLTQLELPSDFWGSGVYNCE